MVAFGQILPLAVLQTPKLGCVNIHASLLPRWRGAAPIQRALLAGDAHTGITIMRMDAGLDTGPMLAQRFTRRSRHATPAKACMIGSRRLGAELMAATLPGIAAGSLREQAQPADGVTYAAKIDKSEARIDWRRDVLDVSRQVRAFNPWPIAETRLNGAQLRIFEAEPAGPIPPQPSAVAARHRIRGIDAGIEVACGRGGCASSDCSWPAASRSRRTIFSSPTPCRRSLRGRMSNPGAGARALAARAMVRILSDDVTLDSALPNVLAGPIRSLNPPCVPWAMAPCAVTFRHEAILSRSAAQAAQIARSSGAGASCRWRFYELEDARTPQYAVVDAAVEAAKSG